MSDPRDRWALETPPEPEPDKDGSEPPEWPMPEGSETRPRTVPPPAPPFSWPTSEGEPTKHEFHHPLDRVTGKLPRRLRIAVDWIVTIVGAIAIVLAIKA